MQIPRIPSSAIPSIRSRSSLCSMSFWTATGSTRSSTNARTVSWISRCSSVRPKSIRLSVRSGRDAVLPVPDHRAAGADPAVRDRRAAGTGPERQVPAPDRDDARQDPALSQGDDEGVRGGARAAEPRSGERAEEAREGRQHARPAAGAARDEQADAGRAGRLLRGDGRDRPARAGGDEPLGAAAPREDAAAGGAEAAERRQRQAQAPLARVLWVALVVAGAVLAWWWRTSV